MAHITHIEPDPEDWTDPFSRAGDTHSWVCTCGAHGHGLEDAFGAAADHVWRVTPKRPLPMYDQEADFPRYGTASTW